MKAVALIIMVGFPTLVNAQEAKLVHALESTPPIVCSPLARIAHLQGSVKVLVEIESGQIGKIEPQNLDQGQSEQNALTKMMIDLVKKFKFKPSFTGKVSIDFSLKKLDAPEDAKLSDLKTHIDWQTNKIEIIYSNLKTDAKPPALPSA